MFVFITRNHRRFEVQDLINIHFDKATTMILNVNLIQIFNTIFMKLIVLFWKTHSDFLKFSIEKSVHHLFSFRKKFLSRFFDAEIFLAIDENIVVYMSNAEWMIEIRKNQLTSDHQILFHVDHKYDETRKFQSQIQSL
jgi:hypothetical protein